MRPIKSLLAITFLACLSPQLCWAAVAWEGVTFHQEATNQTSHSFTIHAINGPNSYVGICAITNAAAPYDVTAVTVGGSNATHKATLDQGVDTRLEYWEFVGASGTPTVVVTTDPADRTAIHVFSYSGVDQATPSGTSAQSTWGGTPKSATVTGVANGLVHTCFGLADDTDRAIANTDGSQTERWDHGQAGTNSTNEAGSSSTCTGSCTLGHSWDGGFNGGVIVVPLNPASDGVVISSELF